MTKKHHIARIALALLTAAVLLASCGSESSPEAGDDGISAVTAFEPQYLLGDFTERESLVQVTIGDPVDKRVTGSEEEPDSHEFVRLDATVEAVLYGPSPGKSFVLELLAFTSGHGENSDETKPIAMNGFIPSRMVPGTELLLAVTPSEESGVYQLTSTRLLGVLDGEKLEVGTELSDLHLLGLRDRETVEAAARGVLELPIARAPSLDDQLDDQGDHGHTHGEDTHTHEDG